MGILAQCPGEGLWKDVPCRYCHLLMYWMHQISANGLYSFAQTKIHHISCDDLEGSQ